MDAKELVKYACEALLERKGHDLEVLHIEQLTTLTEYFVICSATSTTQVKALADSVEFHLKNDHGVMPHHVEGFESSSWILLDYGEVIIHVFTRESREFYDLDRLWQDGVKVDISEYLIREE